MAVIPSQVYDGYSCGVLALEIGEPGDLFLALWRQVAQKSSITIAVLSAFYDLFVGISSFTAGWVAHRFSYSAAFTMSAVALIAAAIAAKFVFVEEAGPRVRVAVAGEDLAT